MRTGRPERLRGFCDVGFHRYFLTFCTFRRRQVFIAEATVNLTRNEILRAADREQFTITAYCFMPDHLHVLVEALAETADARRFIARAKQFSGYAWSARTGQPLWQRYGFERVLRDDDATIDVARYILENPVRAGLASAPEAYPFSGCPGHSLSAVLDAIAWSPRRSG
jgi:putative transposase